MSDERIRQIYKIPESRKVESEHKRLQEDLKNWAIKRGYPSPDELPDGSKPDVIRSDENESLFIGDAKDATNETPSNTKTVKRIKNYIQQFALLLDKKKRRAGIIAIATNNEQAAKNWVTTLNTLCIEAGITDPRTNSEPNFDITKLQKKNTWIIWWYTLHRYKLRSFDI
ncbi:MAG: hypothetical protein VSS75_020020 [Candidatus Parabeggiatoa sp.]|nr:hypothetical protein [Candidatus Parabeggiatoa sp.]